MECDASNPSIVASDSSNTLTAMDAFGAMSPTVIVSQYPSTFSSIVVSCAVPRLVVAVADTYANWFAGSLIRPIELGADICG
jgi:hypothetical protein